MGLFDRLKSLWSNDRLDVAARFDLVREVGFGTMSKFYVARDRNTGQTVGLKILDAAKTAIVEDRFKGLKKPSEGEIQAAIKHPRVCAVLEHGLTTKGEQYLLVEYIEGVALSAFLTSQSSLLDGNRLTLIRQMAEAVEAVHQAGFIHRDICPRNFICAPDGTSLKLIDFGLSLPMSKEFNQPGNRTGTPNYMAPEIARRRPTDKRVDVFSLGVTAYHVCAFELPWPAQAGANNVALTRHSQEPMDILLVRPNLNKTLAAAIMKCVATEPVDRLSSAEHLLRLIRSVKSENET